LNFLGAARLGKFHFAEPKTLARKGESHLDRFNFFVDKVEGFIGH
jgi:hypothetical protein